MAHQAQLGTGNHFSLVLTSDDPTLLTFGENLFAQLGRPPLGVEVNPDPAPVALPPSFTGTVVEVSAGLLHSALLDDDGDVWTWGFGVSGRLGHGDTAQVDAPKKVAALDGVEIVNVEMGGGASFAVDADGDLWGWGQNTVGQLGLGAEPGDPSDPVDGPLTPVRIEAFDDLEVVDVATGVAFTLVLTEDGRVFAMGSNVQGQVGPEGGDARRVPTPVEVDVPGDVVAVGAGNNTAYAVTSDGEVYGWGETRFGQLLQGEIQDDGTLVQGDGDRDGVTTPTLLDALPDNVVDVVGGARWGLALTEDGDVWGWGRNNEGWLGIGSTTGRENTIIAPTKLDALDGVTIVEIQAGTNHALALDDEGNVYGWGAVADGRLGVVEARGPIASPTLIDLTPGPNAIDLVFGDHTTDAIFRLVDLNGDGDAVDPGEVRVFFDADNASGLEAPTGTVLDLFRAADGSIFYGDNPTDTVYRLEDLNGDGDAQDVGEASIWFSAAGNAGGFELGTPNGVTQDADGNVYIVTPGTVSGAPLDVVYRTTDLNGDGDAQDEGEASVWLELQMLNPNSSAFEISFVGNVAYVTDTVGVDPDVIYRIEDKDGSGDIQRNEVTVFIDDDNPFGVNPDFAHDTLGDTVYAVEFFPDTFGDPTRLFALTDRDGSGSIDDASEARVVWSSDLLPEGFSLFATPGMDIASDGTILIAANGIDANEENIIRLVDGNRDGDYLDEGETQLVASKALGVDVLERPRPVEDMRDPDASGLPQVVLGDDGRDVLTADDGAARLYGFVGNDRLTGSAEDDALFGGAGRDALFGGDGDDVLDGGRGRDMLFGGDGADRFVLADGDAPDVVRDFDASEGDVVLVQIAALAAADGTLDIERLRLEDRGTSQVLQADLDDADGFQATTIAVFTGSDPLSLETLLGEPEAFIA